MRTNNNTPVTAAANTAVVMTIPAHSERRKVVSYVLWSYSGTPTGGGLTITSNGVSIMNIDIIAGGPGALRLPEIPGEAASTIVITLLAGGAGVIGKLNAYDGVF